MRPCMLDFRQKTRIYHVFRIPAGYEYTKTHFENGEIIFVIREKSQLLRYSNGVLSPLDVFYPRKIFEMGLLQVFKEHKYRSITKRSPSLFFQ